MSKLTALATFLNVDENEVYNEISGYTDGFNYFTVLTDVEATDLAIERALMHLHTLKPEVFTGHLKPGVTVADIEHLQEKGPEANPAIGHLLVNLYKFLEHVIEKDGRGPWISELDGEENEEQGYYIYRM